MRFRLDAYLLRELLSPFLVALLAFLVFISLELVLSLSDVLFSRGVPAVHLLRLLSFKLPNILTLAAPAGVLLATFLALARLSSDRELLALQALGYSLRRVLLPFLGFGLAISVLSLVFSELVVPRAEALYQKELLALLYRGPAPLMQKNVFFRGQKGELFYVERYTGSRAEGIVVYDLSGRLFPHGLFPALITAKEGVLGPGEFLLREGRVLRFGERGELTEILGFSELRLEVEEKIEEAILGGRTPSQMSTRELRERIELWRKSGLDVQDLLVEYHGKLAVAAAAFFFVLFGAPLGVVLGQRGRAAGMVVGFLLAAGAQALFLWARTLARRGLLPPFLGGWLPHAVLGALGLFLYLGVDRLRFRGLVLFLLTLGLSGFGAPPVRELRAEEVVVEREGRYLRAHGARLAFSQYSLAAEKVEFVENEGWEVRASQAEVELADGRVETKDLVAHLSPEGELFFAQLEDFQGELRFSGPEKLETLLFSGEKGEAQFSEGKVTLVVGKNVLFTTCPCFAEAPYLIWAEEFFLLPESWLFVKNVRVDSFGYPVVWLPFYAARLGEGSVPFLPEVGRTGLGWFLRWSFPWAPWEGAVGALVVTWFPQAAQISPSLHAVWDGGSLSLSSERGFLRLRGKVLGETWQGQADWRPGRLFLDLSGRVRGWSFTLRAGKVEGGAGDYFRLPEVSFSRVFSAGGGELEAQVHLGWFKEGAREGRRTGLTLSWSATLTFGVAKFSIPWKLGIDQYSGAERIYFSLTPSLTLGPFSMWVRERVTLGRSPFDFDVLPSQNQVGFSVSTQAGPWAQKLELGWDLQEHVPLPASWSLSGENLSLAISAALFPPQIARLTAHWAWKGEGWRVEANTGFAGVWQDLILRGVFSNRDFYASGGLRVRLWPFAWRRAYVAAEGAWSPEWKWNVVLEYDFISQNFAQAELGLFRTFSGCLRVGVRVGANTFRLSLDLPAFPEFSVRFAPLDEGLQISGL